MVFDVPTGGRAMPGRPLLIIAGAGSGKTKTLAHRVAHLILNGADPGRILLLTFTRRAAEEMTRRVERICGQTIGGSGHRIEWSGTFHAVGNKLLRLYAEQIGLQPNVTVLDRSDAADLLNLVRDEQGLSEQARRFPKKATCLAIYSYAVNAQLGLDQVLRKAFPWCLEWQAELRQLFAGYVLAKQAQSVADYDDLLLYWSGMMKAAEIAQDVGRRFDFVLVDEYQDTNALQANILLALKADGRGLTVVGDDAQSIYGFRAATVRNILEFPACFAPPAAVVTLEQNYRSTQPILAAANAVMGLAAEGFTKALFSERRSEQKPHLVMVGDEGGEVDYVVRSVLANREAGLELREQAVLFRTSHHSGQLEIELRRRNIPYVMYGGLKFLELAHVKDLLALLRWAENPRDRVAAFRLLQLMPGIGPGTARRALAQLEAAAFRFEALSGFSPPRAAAHLWPDLVALMQALAAQERWEGQLERARHFYDPLLEERYDFARARLADLDELVRLAGTYRSRQQFLTELTLDPPQAAGAEAGVPLLDEDYLILSTIHSAKGREWRAVYVLHVVDGCIPSDMATGSPEEVEEERRLLYVAMTRAMDQLHLIHPRRFYTIAQPRAGDRYVQAPRSRFIPAALLGYFDHGASGPGHAERAAHARAPLPTVDIAAQMRAMWG
ncbi:MAG TPA: ATP-dependent helicase [Geminicoccaceae bacterium]|nr:ATP-dependent helicase [Geminicoccaceae bacterium]